MSSSVPPSTGNSASPPPGSVSTSSSGTPGKFSELKLISHSTLFYWWPVWLLAFFMAAWTFFENNRLAIMPAGTKVVKINETRYEINTEDKNGNSTIRETSLKNAPNLSAATEDPFRPRVSAHAWLGSLFVIVLVLTVVITNVAMRGLWSFIVIMFIILLAVLITLFKAWDDIFNAIGGLHIHINMAGYLFIGCALFTVWALSTLVFDRRAYIIFTPGMIKVCEHIGAAVQAYPTSGISMTKQRDDLFRHYILGFGSGDLVLTIPQGGDKKEVRLPNVLGIGWRLNSVEDMLKLVATA